MILVVPSLLVGIASTALADGGAQVVTDPAGDNANSAGAGSDLVRLGISTDALQLHFHFKVNSVGTPAAPAKNIFYNAYFTVPGTPAVSWVAWVEVAKTTGAITSPRFDHNGGGTCATQNDGGTGTAAWVGNELVLDINRASVGSPADGAVLTGVYAQTFQCTVPTETVYDVAPNSGTTTYTVGDNGSVIGPTTAPGAPSGVAALAGDGRVTVSWAAPSDGGSPITGYSIYRATSAGAETLLVATGTTSTTFVDSGLTNGNTYYYQIAATNAVGTGGLSAEVSASPHTAPAQPFGFTLYQGPGSMVSDVGEGGIGVNWKTGNVMFSGNLGAICCINQKEVRVTFDDTRSPATATWTDVTPPYPNMNIDPVLFTDSNTGRTFAGGDNTYCTRADYTDDDGASWTIANACSTTVDHETIGGGPFADPLHQIDPLYNHTVYHCEWILAADFVVTGSGFGPEGFCTTSWDGGITYNPESLLPCTGMVGHIRVGPDGTAYLPIKNCDGGATAVQISGDDGITFSSVYTGISGPVDGHQSDPSVSAGRGDKFAGGRVYFAAQDATDKMMVTTSTDKGQTWTTPKDLSTPMGVKSATFAETIAGDDDRAAVEWLGTKDAGNAFTNGFTGTWHAYMSITYDGGATWTTVDLTPNDPVQRGCIWLSGGSNACRNLLDFNDISIDATGRVLGEFADGCVAANGCSLPTGTASKSTYSWGTIARQSAGNTLFSAYDTTFIPVALSATAGGAYSGVVSNAIGISAGATGGTAPYTFSWSVAGKPAGSTGGSFANANAAITSFTPDVVGAYTLVMTVHDAAADVATSNALLTASAPAVSGCQPGGVLVANDATNDHAENAGDATEVFCVRMADSGTTIDFYYDVKGQGVSSDINAANPLYYDLYFSLSKLGGQPPSNPTPLDDQFTLEVTYDGGSLSASMLGPDFTPLPQQGFTLSASWVGNTIHVEWARTDATSPANGDTVSGIYLDANAFVTDPADPTSGTFHHYDYVPEPGNYGSYVVGSSGSSGGGRYYPTCGESLGTDPSGDATPGAHDLVKFSASDDATNVKLCWTVADANAHPSAEASYTTFFNAPYQGPGVAYSVIAAINTDGTPDLANSGWAQGACDPVGDCGTFLGGAPVSVEVVGNTIIETIAKSDLGSPADGAQTGSISVDSRDQSDSNGVSPFDRIAASAFTFGRKVMDTTAPSQVTGLLVTNTGTGTSLDLAWDAATDNIGVTQYDVLRSTTSGSGYTQVGTPVGTAFTDSGLTAGTTYYYVVAAEDAAQNVGADSTEVSGTPSTVTPPDTTPPTTPTNLVACGTTTSSACVSWTPSTDSESGVKEYRVFRDATFLGTTTLTTYDDAGLQPSTTYTFTVSAVDNANNEGSQSAALAITTLGFSGPEIHVTTPAAGAQVQAPVRIEGTYSTTGQPQQVSSHTLDSILPWQTSEWASSAFVQLALRSDEFAAVRSQLEGVTGYIGAYPTTDGKIQAMLTGVTPFTAPHQSQTSHWPIVYAENVQVAPIMSVAGHTARNVITLDDIRSGVAAAPTAPPTPGIQDGIGPGTAIQMHDPVDGKTYICTASFLFENPANGKYYLETAGHCLLDAASATDSVATPNKVADKVFLCYTGCINNWNGIGTYIELDRSATYNPVAYAHQNGIGDDAGMIEIPPEVNQYLRPWMFFWSGPTSAPTTDAQAGDLLVHYGHGVGSGAVFPTQGRAAVTINSDGASFEAAGYIWNGDSGSSIGFGQPDPTGRLVTGGAAAGIVTHATGVGTPAGFPGNNFFGTDFDHALDMVQPHLGFRPVLVTQDAVIRTGGSTGPTLGATITTPAEGSAFDLGSAIDAAGTATFTAASGPGTGSLTFYTMQDVPPASAPTGCGPMSLTVVVDTVSRGCGSLAGPVGPAWELVLGPNSFEYDSAAQLSAIPLDATRDITADLYVKGTQSVSPVVLDMEVQLMYGSTMIGSQRLTQTAAPSTSATDFQFAFRPLVPMVPAGEVLKWKVITHQAIGPAYIYSGGATPSQISIPLGSLPTETVDVSVDDPTFDASHAVASVGTDSWTATVPSSMLTIGSHTLYVRATQGATHSPASLVHVSILGGNHVAPTAAFSVSTSGLDAAFTDESTPGDSAIASSSWNFGDSQTGSGATPTHTYAADGTYHVTLLVTDANGLTSSVGHDVTVAATHVWSVLVNVRDSGGNIVATDTQTVAEGDGSWSYVWTSTPPAGSYTVDASLLKDDAATATTTSTFSIPTLDIPPVIDPVAAQSVAQTDTLAFTVTGSDPDGTPITWSLVDGPAGLAFDTATATATWTPTFDDLGAYTATIAASDGELTTTTIVPITVTLTARAPSLTAVPTQTVVELSSLTTWVHASTLNHDIVALTVANLPAGATFTDAGNNSGKITWTPSLGTKGAYTATVTATSYGLTADTPVAITVLQKASLTIGPVGGVNAQAYPGQVLTLSATITNTGPETDTFHFAPSDGADHWTMTTPADVTLAPGASTTVSLTITVPQNGVSTTPSLKATSDGNPNVFKSTAWFVTVPAIVVVTVDNATSTRDVTGNVTVTFLDGSPVVGATIAMTQTPDIFGASFSSSRSGHTDANGVFTFDFSDMGARLPGHHTLSLIVTARLRSSVTSGYDVSATPDGAIPSLP